MYVLDLTGKPRTMGRVVMFGAGGGYGIRHSSTSGMLEIWHLMCGRDAVTRMTECDSMYDHDEEGSSAAYARLAELTR